MSEELDSQITLSTDSCKDFLKLIEKFCESNQFEKAYSKHTVRNYKNDLIGFVMWADRLKIDPLNVNYKNLRLYLADMDSVKYARTTINRRLSSLRSFYRWLDIIGVNVNNFASAMQGPKIPKTLPHVVLHTDIEKLIKLCCDQIDQAKDKKTKAIAIRDYALIELLYATGARISEVSFLELDNVNFESAQVKFFGKGQKERIVPIYSICQNSLYEYLEEARPFLSSENNKNNYFFISNRGGHMSADNMRKMFYKKCELSGVSSSISPHSMRHTFATDVLDGGADLRSVQEMLGHASLSTTQIYTHLSAKKLKDSHLQAHPRA